MGNIKPHRLRVYAAMVRAMDRSVGRIMDSLEEEGIDAASDSGMKKIVTAAGLDWSIAKPLLQNDHWREWAQENLLDMYDNGLWGVPSFRYGQLCTFGQDRLDRLEQAISEERTGHKI